MSLPVPPSPVLLDTDPGIDDALAIALALRSPELSVLGLTVVAGNVDVDQGVDNALRIAELLGRRDLPVARGADRPLAGKLVTARHVHGGNGLGDLTLPAPSMPVAPQGAIELMTSKIQEYPGSIKLIPIGPLTNVATFLRVHPDLASWIGEIVLMGGSASGGNVTAAAEFNIFNDPEAAQIVFESGLPIVMVTLDVTRKTILAPEYLGRLHGESDPVARFVLDLNEFHIRSRKDAGILLHDPVAVGVAIDSSLVKTEPVHVEIETRGEKTRGATVIDRSPFRARFEDRGDEVTVVGHEPVAPNAQWAVDVDVDRFVRLFVERISGTTSESTPKPA